MLNSPASFARSTTSLLTLFCKSSALSFFCRYVVLSVCKFCKIPRMFSGVALSRFAEIRHGSSLDSKSLIADASAAFSTFRLSASSQSASLRFCSRAARPSSKRWIFSISPLILRNLSAKSFRQSAPFSIAAESSHDRCSREPQTGQGSPGFRLRRSSATTTGISL